mmetsp:Transcript_12884/g.34369  ORF Transcript_12884/g.34369 Transcript_12884/m.34369 type:complete len:201 (+) Transcript_12884:1-603(+)
MVIDPWDKPVCLTRVWCLYEVVHTHMQTRTTLHLAMARSERIGFRRALTDDRRAVLQALVGFDARRAQASVAADKEMIFELIRDNFHMDDGSGIDAFEHFNASVRAAVIRALALASWQGNDDNDEHPEAASCGASRATDRTASRTSGGPGRSRRYTNSSHESGTGGFMRRIRLVRSRALPHSSSEEIGVDPGVGSSSWTT